MKYHYIAISMLLLGGKSFTQNRSANFSIRVPIQNEVQNEEITYGPRHIEKGTAINFGVDGLIAFNLTNRLSFYTGLGYFRNRFNIKRPYYHQLINPGTDSLPILLLTKNYTYSLIRIPLALECKLKESQKLNLSVGLEHYFNISFKQKYNGSKPFQGANASYTSLKYFGNSIHLLFSISFGGTSNKVFALQPYTRVLYAYKEDGFLFDRIPEHNKKYFDAIGVAFKYNL